MNVFDHQRFRLRRPPTPEHPLGEQVQRTYREIMTGPDEELRFDYPLECYNIGALCLCVALTQAFFEPEDVAKLARRLQSPIPAEEFAVAVAGADGLFGIDEGMRFMQGPEPQRDSKGRIAGLEPLADRLSLTSSGFLNRPNVRWVVAADQIPLLLFTRSTFYEKSAGRGYLTGTSGDLEIRTFAIDPASLRRTIWLNVLSRESQGTRFTADGYDGWMWADPPHEDVPKGHASLRSGLFWQVAYNYVHIETIQEPRPCMVTGELVQGAAGTAVATRASGIGFGVKVARETGPDVRDSFFLHPNGPYFSYTSKQGALVVRHLSVDDVSGIIGWMGGLFFSTTGDGPRQHRIAPVLQQLYLLRDELGADETPRSIVECFGFHMLSSKQNIHGGYETERYEYPLLGIDADTGLRAMEAASTIMNGCASIADETRRLLTHAVQLCMMEQVDTDRQEPKGPWQGERLVFKAKSHVDTKSFAVDIGRDFWYRTGRSVNDLLVRIGAAGGDVDKLVDQQETITIWWRTLLARHARDLFLPVFNDYSASPQHLMAAHNASAIFFGTLRNKGVRFHEPTSGEDNASSTDAEPNS